MISSNDFRPGVTVEIDGNVWQVVDSWITKLMIKLNLTLNN